MPVELLILGVLFIVAALVYASVGFGGGTAYLAMLTLSGVPIQHVPAVALICNIIVVSGAAWHFAKAGHFRASMALPLLLASVPAAYLGGTTALDNETLRMVTGFVLILVAVAMIIRLPAHTEADREMPPRPLLWTVGPAIGGATGGLAGLIGIGGGVFLAPAMHLLSWGAAKQIAATCAVFILLNSIAGLGGRMTQMEPEDLSSYFVLFAAVVIGGQIGSRMGVKRLSPPFVRRLTAVVVLIAAINLLVTT